MTFGPDEKKGARVTSLDEYKKCLDYFQKEGYSEVDTAESYIGGQQMAFTAQAGWKERGLTLATKYYPKQEAGHTEKVLREKLDRCLSELKTDCVDIFYLHAPDRWHPFEEALEACNKLHKEGKFVQLGISNFTAFEVAECVITCKERGWVRPTIYQGMYNAITRSLETETIVACHRYGIDVVIYVGRITTDAKNMLTRNQQNPLAGGLFSGKVKSADVPQEGRFSDTAQSGSMYRKRYFRDATFDALRLIEEAAQKHNLTLLEIALRWCVHHSALKIKNGGGDGIIIGVSSLSQLEGNLRDLDKGPLSEEVIKTLDQAWLITKPTTPNYWHLDLKYSDESQAALSGRKK